MLRSFVAFVVALCATLTGCRSAVDVPSDASGFRSNATQYTVAASNGSYRVDIGFEFRNTTGATLSQARCGQHANPPVLEKWVDDRWVPAYSPVVLMCLTLPHFTLAPGAVYRDTLHVWAGEAGSNRYPQFEAGPVPGAYRLRWGLRVGPDPESGGASSVAPASNPFRLVVH